MGKNFYRESPQTKSNIFSALEKEQRRKQRGEILHSLSFSFLPSRSLSSPLLPSAPSHSVFRLSSLREWSTIKGLIKVLNKQKPHGGVPDSVGPARTGRRAEAPIRPRSWAVGCRTSGWGCRGWRCEGQAPVPGTARRNRC